MFFRASTQAEAQRLALRGWVRNLPDGRVEVLACGKPEAIDELAAWLQQGPPLAQVEAVRSSEADPAELRGTDDFRTA